jgi:hypothetical protein
MIEPVLANDGEPNLTEEGVILASPQLPIIDGYEATRRIKLSGRLPDFCAFVEDTPTATLVRQVLGAVAQFDKAMTMMSIRPTGARLVRELAHRTRACKRQNIVQY